MLDKVMSVEYRNKFLDSDGKGIIYNWHCVDNVGVSTNERRRDIGFGNIFRHYKRKVFENGQIDSIHWHFHPLSFNKEAHISSTSYVNSYAVLYEILCRRLIEFEWFPIVNRAGYHAVRQDSSFFLEQWIPFDYSNQAMYRDDGEHFDHHRFGDWRRAPKTWIPYHPSHDDYQTPGSMNRYTTKCLNIGTRLKLIDEFEIEMAFQNAIENGSAILSFTNHDFRDIAVDIEDVYAKIGRVSEKFPNVSIHNSDAITAMQKVVFSDNVVENEAIKLELETEAGVTSSKILVHCEKGRYLVASLSWQLKPEMGDIFTIILMKKNLERHGNIFLIGKQLNWLGLKKYVSQQMIDLAISQ